MTSPSDLSPGARGRGPVPNLGGRLRRVRIEAGLSAREVARQLEVSPSFVSQIETGRSQPSVATLYALAQLFAISLDDLFEPHHPDAAGTPQPHERRRRNGGDAEVADPAGRSVDPEVRGHARQAWPPRFGVSVVRSNDRATLRLQSGVQWQRLAVTSEPDVDFMEVVYPVGSASTPDASMLHHVGHEYHYVLRGALQVTVDVDEYVLRQGDSMGFDSSLPHLLRNPGEVDTHCIVTTHRCSAAQ